MNYRQENCRKIASELACRRKVNLPDVQLSEKLLLTCTRQGNYFPDVDAQSVILLIGLTQRD